MPTAPPYGTTAAPEGPAARPRRARGAARLLSGAVLLGLALLPPACAPETPATPSPTAAATAPAAAAPALPPVLPFDEAVLNAANRVFSSAPVGEGDRWRVVIDPLVDGVTGEQSAATRRIGERIAALAAERYPRFQVLPFTPAEVARSPHVLVGTFTPVNARNQPTGEREAYRFCLVMADLRSGRVVAKGVARARLEGVDSGRTAFFRDSPAWTEDPSVRAYIQTCQATQVGEAINATYVNGILAASLVADAIEAYDAGRYREALDLYGAARSTPAGEQLRVYNGLYLANWRLGRRAEAAEAFGQVVEYGLRSGQLAVMLLFRPGSTAFVADSRISGPYEVWLQQIGARAAGRSSCLQVTGHTSRSGPAALNERLALLRAEYVKGRLEGEAPGLRGRLIADGAGANRNLVGTGAEDTSDALDRRVEFRVVPNC